MGSSLIAQFLVAANVIVTVLILYEPLGGSCPIIAFDTAFHDVTSFRMLVIVIANLSLS